MDANRKKPPTCQHCDKPLGTNGDCFWCHQAANDELYSQTVDSFEQRGENAYAFMPVWLERMQREIGVVFV